MAAAARRAGRDPAAVRLVGAAKKQPVERVAAALRAGLRDLGENYVQEAVAMRDALRAQEPALAREITWHGIGHLQTNKARDAAACFDWLHGVDSARLAQGLAKHAAAAQRTLVVLLQVNLSGEATKSGVSEAELPALLDAVRALPALRAAGLMTMPAPSPDPEAARPVFAKLRTLCDRLGLEELSMGMSDDFEVAVEEGATLVRIGTALFGERGSAQGDAT
ncbi:MAG: YggS family pyridoxal phosphate-dependent enzyme [Proteobacteria bacterium]|nr:MAG: YggS family pyridoxal phosphate-dependent enzyme [Pseudomonadota bacterium]